MTESTRRNKALCPERPGGVVPLPGPIERMPTGLGAGEAAQMLAQAVAMLEACGVAVGAGDRDGLAALAGAGPRAVAVVASLLGRAGSLGWSASADAGQPGLFRALRIPADPHQVCRVVIVANSGSALSDAIGGGCLDEALHGRVDEQGYCLYADEKRALKGLVVNSRSGVIAAALRCGLLSCGAATAGQPAPRGLPEAP